MHGATGLRLIAVALGLFRSTSVAHEIQHGHYMHRRATNHTATTESLNTWWHETGEVNTRRPVADGNVRQSHKYSVQVASVANASTFYDSFVYETIPRSGKAKLCCPNSSNICDEDDQISIEDDIGVTMGWSQFLYGGDVVVKVARLDRAALSKDNITIRPTNLDFNVTANRNYALIHVPYTPDTNGARFSVEFADDIFEYRAQDDSSSSHYVQNVNQTGDYYVESYNDSMPVVGREPLNSLLIFASPFPSTDKVPSNTDDVYRVKPGLVSSLEDVTQSVVSFGPGVYWFTGQNRAVLSSSVSWIYLAPGAYVKGAVQYQNSDSPLKATGFGVLSGEQYVYQANFEDGFCNSKSDTSSVKMWRGANVTASQSWTMSGITTNAPPFNSMDFYDSDGNTAPTGFSVQVSDYKQVGAFYGQTDGLEMYTNGHLSDIFYHSGDDTVKAYYSNVLAERITVWKTNNAPIIQMGWYPRTISNITIDQLNVIHTRYTSTEASYPRALVGSAASYEDPESTDTADVTAVISDITVSNARAEGISPALVSLNLLSHLEGLNIENVWIEEFSPIEGLGTSTVTGFTDPDNGNQTVAMGTDSQAVGLSIKNYRVGDTLVSFDNNNWNATSTGALNVDSVYWGKWTVQQ